MAPNPGKLVTKFILAAAVAASLLTSASAQANIRSVTFYTVKPDRLSDFQAHIKEYQALLAKGGSVRYSTVWLSLTGPRTWALARYYKTWAELDAGPEAAMKEQATELAQINTRIGDCIESSRRTIEEVDPGLSLPDSGSVPKMLRVLVTQVRPDKFADYRALAKSDILPAVKKSGAKDFTMAQGRYGEPSATMTSVLGFNSWAELDEGLGAEKGLGKDGYAALLMKTRPLVVSSEYDVYRYQPELSYLPASTK